MTASPILSLPTIGRAYGDLQNVPWVATAYLLTGTAASPEVGKLSDIHGRRTTMLAAIAIFLAGSILCALAPSLIVLILGRAVQGFGGGSLILLAMTVLADIAAPKDRAKYYTYCVIVFASSGALGPALGGFFAQYLDWTVIFWINLPLGVLSFLLSNAQLRRLPRHGRRHRLDLIGAGLVMVATAALMTAIDLGGNCLDWGSAPITGLAALSAATASWVCFAVRLRRAPEPLVPLGMLSSPVVIFAILANSMGSSSVMVLNLFVPMFLQLFIGLGASDSGLLLMTLMFSFNVGARVSGQMTAQVRRYKVMPIIGLVLALSATVAPAFAAGRFGLVTLEALLTIIGFGFGTVPPVATVSLQNAVERDQLGAATASLNFVRSLAGTTFVGVFGAILTAKLGAGVLQGTTSVAAAVGNRVALGETFQIVFFGTSAGFALSLLALWRLEERPLRANRPAVHRTV